MMRIALVGEALIDFAGAGNLVFQGHSGGSPLNSAVACARLGQPTGYLTQLSTDLFGEHLLNEMQANGIDTVLEFSSPEIVTRSAFPTTVTEAIVAFVAVTLAALATARVPGLVTGKSTAVSDVACVVPLIVL